MKNKLNLFQQVRELNGWAAVAYATTLVERMMPNYVLFCEATQFSDGSQLRNTLNLFSRFSIGNAGDISRRFFSAGSAFK